MNEKKGLPLWRILFCVGALIIDVAMIFLAVRFFNYHTLDIYGQIVFKHAWPLAFIPCLALSIVGLIINREFTAIRAFAVQLALTILFGSWLAFSQNTMLFSSPDAGIFRIFSVASICLIAALVLYQLDIVLNNPIRRFFFDQKSTNPIPAINTDSMSLAEKKALLKTVNESLKNDRVD
ncbi:MAG: hypothetical protein IJG85_04840 [Eubacteriaceae bacterium]|nr:hypothetical protein [Eubacteriaceae bacterium]MBR0384329.1 hypothetical protein [Eubacteriaceae bacterium]